MDVLALSSFDVLPADQLFSYHEPSNAKGVPLRFRLTYQGPLPSQGAGDTRSKEKNVLRSHFHDQLRELWVQHPMLRLLGATAAADPLDFTGLGLFKIANRHNHIYNYFPLIGDFYGVSCSLHIVFLRRDAPGGLVKHGGDIDNRIKVLFDGLRMPSTPEMPDSAPAANQDPFFCLLQDDRFIDEVGITTDRLLTPLDQGNVHDVLLVIDVKTLVFDHTKSPGFMY